MATFMELASKRRSCRAYSGAAIDRKDIEKCVEAALLAPSACNAQPWKFIIIDSPDVRKAVAATFLEWEKLLNAFAPEAAVFVAVVSERQKALPWLGGKISGKDFRQMDIGLASAHFVLEAQDLGIGTCILGWFDERRIKKILGVPAAKRIELLITMGYPDKERFNPPPRKLKDRSETVGYNRY